VIPATLFCMANSPEIYKVENFIWSQINRKPAIQANYLKQGYLGKVSEMQ
jgi:hypothetical protein